MKEKVEQSLVVTAQALSVLTSLNQSESYITKIDCSFTIKHTRIIVERGTSFIQILSVGITYFWQGPCINGHVSAVQNSDIVP